MNSIAIVIGGCIGTIGCGLLLECGARYNQHIIEQSREERMLRNYARLINSDKNITTDPTRYQFDDATDYKCRHIR